MRYPPPDCVRFTLSKKASTNFVRPVGRPWDEKTANKWYRFAQLSHAFGQNDQAAAAYRGSADLSPKQAFPLGGLGWALYEAGRYQEAIAAFEEAEKRQPGYLKSAPEVEKRYQESLAAVKG